VEQRLSIQTIIKSFDTKRQQAKALRFEANNLSNKAVAKQYRDMAYALEHGGKLRHPHQLQASW
jgi:hypothetical protein